MTFAVITNILCYNQHIKSSFVLRFWFMWYIMGKNQQKHWRTIGGHYYGRKDHWY